MCDIIRYMKTNAIPTMVDVRRSAGAHLARALGGVLIAATLCSCATVTTLVEHRNLQITTRMSSSLFMEPTAQADRSVFLQVQNTNDKGDFGLGSALAAVIQSRGWTIVADPAQAHVILQVGVLQAGKMQVQGLQNALVGGFGSVLATAAIGAGIAAAAGGSGAAIGGTAIGLGTADYVGGLLVKPETYSVVADVRVLQRRPAPPAAPAMAGETSAPQQPAGGGSMAAAAPAPGDTLPVAMATTLSEQPSVTPPLSMPAAAATPSAPAYTTQKTRVICFVDRTNLTWDEAMPALRLGLVNTLAGLF